MGAREGYRDPAPAGPSWEGAIIRPPMTTATKSDRPAVGCPVCGGATTTHLIGLYDDRYGHPGLYDTSRCRVCGHVFTDATFSDEELGRLYSEWYPRASRRWEELPQLSTGRGFRDWFNGEGHAAHLSVPREVSVLDVGCGYGKTLEYHEARGCRAVGVEADEHAVAEARRHGLTVLEGVFHADEHEPASFDYVTLDQVLEHAREPLAFLTGIASVLKPGGRVVVSTPNAASYGARLFGARWINWHVPYHLNLFTKGSLGRLARDAGLEVRSIRTTTASAWLRYQFLHRFTRPAPGKPSRFWDPRRADGHVGKRIGRWAARLDRFKVFQLTTRLADALGIGDNMVAVLVKPERA
jgi:2-polyprenyl-3-methyl-5-hydroxy-6-metoxy-1,4-benzoquinol methylase